MMLADLLPPERTTVVTQERQRGIVGPDAGLVAFADEATREEIPNLIRLMPSARARPRPNARTREF